MENPHEAEQAVLLERIIKNVVSQADIASEESTPAQSSLAKFPLRMSSL
jgi:hypothetical protein